MYYLIAFDVSDDKVRRKLTKILLAEGHRIQESVFIVNLKKNSLQPVAAKLEKTLNKKGLIHIFSVCGTCTKKSLAINKEVELYVIE